MYTLDNSLCREGIYKLGCGFDYRIKARIGAYSVAGDEEIGHRCTLISVWGCGAQDHAEFSAGEVIIGAWVGSFDDLDIAAKFR